MTTPYTYLIGWSKHNTWYYGCRYAKNCSPEDLWKKYFTSSKYVNEFRNTHGKPDVIEIRKTFITVEEATCWEEKVIRRMKCVLSENWINRGNARKQFYNISKPSNAFSKGYISTATWKKGNTRWNKGKKNVQSFTEERNKQLANALKRKYEITKPNGEVEIILGLKDYCLNNNWNYTTVASKVKSEKSNMYRNHKIVRIDGRPSGHTR